MERQLYLVHCQCGHGIEVTAAKAGTQVACPACQAECLIPSLRQLQCLDGASYGQPEVEAVLADPVCVQPAHSCIACSATSVTEMLFVDFVLQESPQQTQATAAGRPIPVPKKPTPATRQAFRYPCLYCHDCAVRWQRSWRWSRLTDWFLHLLKVVAFGLIGMVMIGIPLFIPFFGIPLALWLCWDLGAQLFRFAVTPPSDHFLLKRLRKLDAFAFFVEYELLYFAWYHFEPADFRPLTEVEYLRQLLASDSGEWGDETNPVARAKAPAWDATYN